MALLGIFNERVIMDTDKMIAMIEKAHTIAAQKRIPFQPTEHGYSNYQDGCLAMKLALLAMLSETESAEDQEIFPGTLAALERLTPNVLGNRLAAGGATKKGEIE